jgi:hypothetical protein
MSGRAAARVHATGRWRRGDDDLTRAGAAVRAAGDDEVLGAVRAVRDLGLVAGRHLHARGQDRDGLGATGSRARRRR